MTRSDVVRPLVRPARVLQLDTHVSAEDAHLARPWRVHTLAADFHLLDVWEIPLRIEAEKGESFLTFYRLFAEHALAMNRPIYPLTPTSVGDLVHVLGLAAAGFLMSFRLTLGRLLGLDGHRSLAIPGCEETSLRQRLTVDDDKRNRVSWLTLPKGPAGFTVVYVSDDESLAEVSNRTIHALLHLSWVVRNETETTVVMAIYTKSRGWLSDTYLALIKPFRHIVVYPTWIRHLVKTWDARGTVGRR